MADENTYNGTYQLEFEKPLIELEAQIVALEQGKGESAVNIDSELKSLRDNHTAMLKKSLRQAVALAGGAGRRGIPARPQAVGLHPPHSSRTSQELHGDRRFGDDPAIITGFGRIGSAQVPRRRPQQGQRHEGEDRLPLRLRPSGGLPQGDG
jgi:acetyl-CoA carboxylase carboxyl transferase subunit alpha